MKKTFLASLLILSAGTALAEDADARARQMARKLYISLTGLSPTVKELDYLQEKIKAQKYKEAAKDIIDQRGEIKNSGAFYNVTVKDMVTPWTNKDKTTLAPLNDMTATIIGWVRDEKKFNDILHEDTVYIVPGLSFQGEVDYFKGNNYPAATKERDKIVCERDLTPKELANNESYRIVSYQPINDNILNPKLDPINNKCRLTKYNLGTSSTPGTLAFFKEKNYLYIHHKDAILKTHEIDASNLHYENISEQGLDLGDKNLLTASSQKGTLHPAPPDESEEPKYISGLMTTRAYGSAFVVAGTNRAPVAFAIENFFCRSMEEMNDTTIPDDRNRRDVDRSPGGTSEIYKNRCIGCHAGMDALAGAFAFYDWIDGKLVYKDGAVVPKMNHNQVFPEGKSTDSDNWVNYWDQGQNKILGWGPFEPGPNGGNYGVKSLAKMFSETKAFHSCMAKTVYEKVCLRPAKATLDKERVAKLTELYKSNNYNMKNLFINASVECMED